MEHDPTNKIPTGEQIELFANDQEKVSESQQEEVKNESVISKEELDELYAPDPDDFLRGQR